MSKRRDSATPIERRGSQSAEQLADSSRFKDSEFNDDPQWPLVFFEHYRRLVAQEGSGNVEEYVVAEDDEKGGSQSLLAMLSSAVGDMSSITIPISYIEPISFLQRLCEAFAYSEILDRAADETDPARRIALVATYFISAHHPNTRTAKPFNPLLGETFEFVREGKGAFKFVGEQVSHHPPIAAIHAHNEKWELWDEKRVSSKFGGNSLTMQPLGTFHLVLKTTDELYSWKAVYITAHNVIVGSTWVEHHGESVIRNSKSGYEAHIQFVKAGWLSKNRYEVKVSIKDDKGKECATLKGKWTESMTLSMPGRDDEVVWKAEARDESHPWGFTKFTDACNEIKDARLLPPTDSRLRPDRLLLYQKNLKKAGGAKKALENKQREAKKARVAAGKQWVPRFFVPASSNAEDPNEWHFNGRYWAMRDARLEKVRAGLPVYGEADAPKKKKKKKKSALGTPAPDADADDDDDDDDDDNSAKGADEDPDATPADDSEAAAPAADERRTKAKKKKSKK